MSLRTQIRLLVPLFVLSLILLKSWSGVGTDPSVDIKPLSAIAATETVKITPLGNHIGKFCRLDRAMVLEDPNGWRILDNADRTVAEADDPQRGDIDVVLISHGHGEYLGDRHIEAVDPGRWDIAIIEPCR